MKINKIILPIVIIVLVMGGLFIKPSRVQALYCGECSAGTTSYSGSVGLTNGSISPSANVDQSTAFNATEIAGQRDSCSSFACLTSSKINPTVTYSVVNSSGTTVLSSTTATPVVCGTNQCASASINTSGYANGSYTLKAVASAVGFSSNSYNYSFTVQHPLPPSPTCSSGAPQFATTSATSGTFYAYAYGVSGDVTSVTFPTWGDPGGQDDLIWYPGVNLGGGTWRASIDLGNHKAGNPEYGQFYTHIYMSSLSYSNVFCGTANWVRTIPPPPSVSASCQDGSNFTLSWALPSGYSNSYVRVLDTTTGQPLYYSDWNYQGNSWSGTATPGHTYSSWVHTAASSSNYSNSTSASPDPITCPPPITNAVASCDSSNVYHMSWNFPSGYNQAFLRIQDTTTGAMLANLDQYASTSWSGQAIANHTYHSWIHTEGPGGYSTYSQAVAPNPDPVTCNFSTYTISASSGANGSVTPAGTTTVNYGNSQTYTISPSVGYSISSVIVDGSPIGAVSSHTFSNVSANHTISATFNNTGSSSADCGPTIANQIHYQCIPVGAQSGNNHSLTSKWTWTCTSQDGTYTAPICTQYKVAPKPVEN